MVRKRLVQLDQPSLIHFTRIIINYDSLSAALAENIFNSIINTGLRDVFTTRSWLILFDRCLIEILSYKVWPPPTSDSSDSSSAGESWSWWSWWRLVLLSHTVVPARHQLVKLAILMFAMTDSPIYNIGDHCRNMCHRDKIIYFIVYSCINFCMASSTQVCFLYSNLGTQSI